MSKSKIKSRVTFLLFLIVSDTINNMLTQEKITEITEYIKQKINPSMLYLFGSYIYGSPNENSDLDILVVKKKIENKREELVSLIKNLASKDYSLDIMLYTEKEFNKNKKEGWKIFDEITTKGIKIIC